MKVITLQNIGEVFFRLYESEINFRFENFWDGGYTWSITGYEGEPESGEIRWTRIEIDNAIDDFIMWPDKKKQLNTIHFMKKDWLMRGSAKEISEAVRQLCDAVCLTDPASNFTKWYLDSYPKKTT